MTAVKAIHVGLKQLGIQEDDRRDLYQRVTGKRSLTDMTPAEKDTVVAELRRLGFRQSTGGGKATQKLQGQYAPKLQALWIAGWNLGLIRDRSDTALLSFVHRQTGLDHTRFLHHAEDAKKAIEALKGWLERDGGVDWSRQHVPAYWLAQPGARIAFAQWEKLLAKKKSGGSAPQYTLYCSALAGGKELGEMERADWMVVMNALGRQIRGGK